MTDSPASASLEPSEVTRITAHFDALTEWNAAPDALLRTAVALAGCAAGVATRHLTLRLDARGDRIPGVAAATHVGATREVPGFGRVWLERDGPSLPGDSLILERLAVAIGLTLARIGRATEDRAPLETLLDPHAPREDRAAAVERLRLDATRSICVIATPSSTAVLGRSVVVPTRVGVLRAALDDGSASVAGRVGVGIPTDPHDLPVSWASATIALRISSDARPRVEAGSLGPLLRLLQLADDDPAPHPDVAALARAAARERDALRSFDALLTTDSVRSAAVAAGVHHSTMQRRVIEFTEALGFDPTAPEGRVRLAVGLDLHRLATARFD